MQAKRILVIEESEVVRETLALILGREFVVAKRPFGKGVFSFAETDRDVDLLILGVTPAIGKEPSSLLRFADRAPFSVLFLVDSKSAARARTVARWPLLAGTAMTGAPERVRSREGLEIGGDPARRVTGE